MMDSGTTKYALRLPTTLYGRLYEVAEREAISDCPDRLSRRARHGRARGSHERAQVRLMSARRWLYMSARIPGDASAVMRGDKER
jgi:hypothetical protein